MTLVRAQLGDRLGRQLAQAYRRWRHPPAAADQATGSCSGRHRRPVAVSAADTNPPDTNRPDTTVVPDPAATATASAVSGSTQRPAAVSGCPTDCGGPAAATRSATAAPRALCLLGLR